MKTNDPNALYNQQADYIYYQFTKSELEERDRKIAEKAWHASDQFYLNNPTSIEVKTPSTLFHGYWEEHFTEWFNRGCPKIIFPDYWESKE